MRANVKSNMRRNLLTNCHPLPHIFSHQDANLKFLKIQRTLQRVKKSGLPKNPTNIEEINAAFRNDEIMNTYGTSLQSSKKYKFFSGGFETPDHSFCVFSSEAMIELIEQNIPPADRHILMDATFQICPVGPFKQILIFYIRKCRQVCATHVLQIKCQISLFDLFIVFLFFSLLSFHFHFILGFPIRICIDVSQKYRLL